MKTTVSILHFITELSTGGAQSALFRLLAHQDRQRYQPTVVCLYNGDGAVANQIRGLGIEVIDLGMTSQIRFDAFWRFFRLLRNLNPDCLHTWMFHANIPGRIVGRLAGTPTIISSERTMGQEGKLRLWLNRWTSPLADRIICVSQQVAKFAKETIGLSQDKLVVIPNGINLGHYPQHPDIPALRLRLQLPQDVILLGAIGRPRPVKGYPFLIDAFSDALMDLPSLHLLFVGDGPQQAELLAQAKCLKVSNSITFWGDRDDIPSVMGALDILVSSSIWEGMPNVVLEAMGSGIPVIATDVGGTKELVKDGDNGLLVPAADVYALANAIKRLATAENLRSRMGCKGRQQAEAHFTIERSVAATEAIYRELLEFSQ